MRRVVITGMGIVSSIGNNTQEVLASLHEAKSGISRAEKYAELGFRSQVPGAPTLYPSTVVDRRAMPAVREKLLRRARALRIGDPSNPEVDYGPLINERFMAGFTRQRETGIEGGRVWDRPHARAPKSA